MPARKYATFILWPQPVCTCVCVCVWNLCQLPRPQAACSGPLHPLPPPSLSTYLPVACYVAVPVVACCMRWHFCHADILHFTAIPQLSPTPTVSETVPWFNFTQFVGAMLCIPPLPPPPRCIFSNAIGYLEYLNAVISCRKLRLDLCVCAPLKCTPSSHTSCRCSCVTSCNYLLPTFERSWKVAQAWLGRVYLSFNWINWQF